VHATDKNSSVDCKLDWKAVVSPEQNRIAGIKQLDFYRIRQRKFQADRFRLYVHKKIGLKMAFSDYCT
jgi:hypothetical protein